MKEWQGRRMTMRKEDSAKMMSRMIMGSVREREKWEAAQHVIKTVVKKFDRFNKGNVSKFLKLYKDEMNQRDVNETMRLKFFCRVMDMCQEASISSWLIGILSGSATREVWLRRDEGKMLIRIRPMGSINKDQSKCHICVSRVQASFCSTPKVGSNMDGGEKS